MIHEEIIASRVESWYVLYVLDFSGKSTADCGLWRSVANEGQLDSIVSGRWLVT